MQEMHESSLNLVFSPDDWPGLKTGGSICGHNAGRLEELVTADVLSLCNIVYFMTLCVISLSNTV